MTPEGYTIPILNEKMGVIDTVQFHDNLTMNDVPDYVNMGCRIGLCRLNRGDQYVHNGELVIMYYDNEYPERSYAEFITEKEAYSECLHRGKLDVAKKLGLRVPPVEREVL